MSSPTHVLTRTEDAIVRLAQSAEMDRDIVIVLDGLPEANGLVVRTEVGAFAAAAVTSSVTEWSNALTVTLLIDNAGLAGQSRATALRAGGGRVAECGGQGAGAQASHPFLGKAGPAVELEIDGVSVRIPRDTDPNRLAALNGYAILDTPAEGCA